MLDERKDRGADSSSRTLMKICRGGHDTVQDEKQCYARGTAVHAFRRRSQVIWPCVVAVSTFGLVLYRYRERALLKELVSSNEPIALNLELGTVGSDT